ncbi:MAG: hypothetical protein KatS3mg005_4158 [Bryobacteraceae bacterium]|nr:MAG: hypothetical protein KatS3mg005_4158 [Bryobacteraceae bacterium]
MKRRKNSSPAAALSEKFHGRPVRKVRDYIEVSDEPTELADLGRLVELQVLAEKHVRVLEFKDGVRVAATPDGGQLYFVGGDQEIDLKTLALDKYLPKDHVTLGPVAKIAYYTSKAFHDFQPSVYEHRFGEDGGSLPLLHYDVRNKRLYLTGGSYQVRPEGIVN